MNTSFKRQKNNFCCWISLMAFAFLMLLTGCQSGSGNFELKEGDILFQDLNCGPLCDAIESVTQGADGRNFSHCAIVVKVGDSLKVVEAIGDTVQINSLYGFFRRTGDTGAIKNICVGRLKESFRNLIPAAVSFSEKQIGKPYDEEFLPENGSWYCSELIYEAFKEANNHQAFFKLEPMTFKNPKTGNFDTAWVDYYKQLGKQIPEAIPGINPGLISRSDKIDFYTPFNVSNF